MSEVKTCSASKLTQYMIIIDGFITLIKLIKSYNLALGWRYFSRVLERIVIEGVIFRGINPILFTEKFCYTEIIVL